ncbi:MAG: AEC family transporter [Desulfobulbaceae bacterium]|nr:AEC family transporter [Desulfobulbaceae bacterium]
MIVLDSLFPIFTLLLLGWFLRRQKFTDASFLNTADRLTYYIFFPILLFWKIGGASFENGIDWSFCIASLLTLLVMFVLSTVVIKLFGISDFKAGSFSQSCYRFNSYIGFVIILNSLGEEGVKYFGVLIGFAIPLINVFAVSLLVWFSGKKVNYSQRLSLAARAMVSNPLILGCLAGVLYSRAVGDFPLFIDNSLRLASMIALPLALISIGGSLTFAGVKGNLNVSLLASVLKLIVLPILGWSFFYFFNVTGIAFKVGILFFTLPASPAIHVLSSQMNSDTQLASSTIVISTILSIFSLSVALLL